MHNKKDDCSCQATAKDELIERLMWFDWLSEASLVRKSLRKLTTTYLASDVCDSESLENRQDISFHINIISDVIDELEKFTLFNP